MQRFLIEREIDGAADLDAQGRTKERPRRRTSGGAPHP